ncbi:MAG: TolC family protein [Elusimicrobia bacterium]|nr:TolC family protein [Elusimicrobiota bacterium]
MKKMSKIFIAAKKTICLIFILFFSAIIALQAQEKITLMKCIEQAKAYSKALSIQSENKEQAYQRLIEVKGGMMPSVFYRYQKAYQDNVNGTVPGEFTDSKFEVTQPIFKGFTKVNSFKANRNELQRQEYLIATVNRQLLSAVANAFYTLGQHESDYKNLGETITLLQQRVDELNERVRLGKSRESEVLVVQSEIASLKAQAEQTKGDGADSLESLSYLTGIDSSKLIISDDTQDIEQAVPIDKVLESALNRSEMRALLEQIKEQNFRLAIAKGDFLPTLDLDANYYTVRSNETYANAKWDAAFSLNLPLFQGGSSLAKAREQQSLLRQLEDQRVDLQRSIRKEVQSFYRQLVSAIDQVRALKDAYDKANQSYKLQVRDYRLGLVENIDVLQSLTSLLDAKTSLDRAKIRAKSLAALLEISSETLS